MRAFHAPNDLFTGLLFKIFGRMPLGLTVKGSGLGRGEAGLSSGLPEASRRKEHQKRILGHELGLAAECGGGHYRQKDLCGQWLGGEDHLAGPG